MKDAHGYQLTGCNGEAQALLDQALAQFRCLHAASLATTEAALQASPELVMGHVLHAWLYLLGTEAAALPVARASRDRALALPHNEREARHLHALGLLMDGRWYAAGRALEDLSVDYPHDLLALQAGHQIDFFTGDARMLRDRIARVLPDWSLPQGICHAVFASRRGLLPAVRVFIDFLAEHLPPQLEASRLDCGGACERAKEKIKASALGALAVDAG